MINYSIVTDVFPKLLEIIKERLFLAELMGIALISGFFFFSRSSSIGVHGPFFPIKTVGLWS